MSIRNIRVGRRDSDLIPVDKITVDKSFNVREDLGDIEGLARDIAQNGLHHPLKVRVEKDSNQVVLIDGHRRLQAIKYARKHLNAPLDAVYCLSENKGGNEETRILEMFSTGTHTKPLTPLEQARVFKRLVDLNWSVARIAEQTGFGEPKVRSLLDLNSATPELRQAVVQSQISPSAASVLAKQDADKQQKALKKASGKKVRVSDVQKLTVGKVYTLSTKKVSDHLNETKETLKQLESEGETSEWLKGVEYGLMVALGKKSFSLKNRV